MSLPPFPTATVYDFGRSKERRKPLFSREIAVLIYAILAASLIICAVAAYQVTQMLQFEQNRAAPDTTAIDRLTKTRNLLIALLVVESVTISLGLADYFM